MLMVLFIFFCLFSVFFRFFLCKQPTFPCRYLWIGFVVQINRSYTIMFSFQTLFRWRLRNYSNLPSTRTTYDLKFSHIFIMFSSFIHLIFHITSPYLLFIFFISRACMLSSKMKIQLVLVFVELVATFVWEGKWLI